MNGGMAAISLMFDYASMSREDLMSLAGTLEQKILRWLVAHHPDNRTRKIFLEMTNVKVGRDSVVNSNFIVSDGYEPLLTIGRRVAISPNVTVICQSGPNNSNLKEIPYVKQRMIRDKPVVIGDDVWIGAGAILLPGIMLGEGSIVGAGAVVAQDVPPWTVVAGVPARVIRHIDHNSSLDKGDDTNE